MPPIEELENEERQDIVTHLQNILNQLDITLSALKATGTETPRTLSNVYDQITSILSQFDLTLTSLRDAIVNATTPTDLLAIYNQLAATLPRNITTWGGTAVTGRDISADLAKLDIALSALRDAIVNGTTPTDLLAVKNEITTLLGTQQNRSAWAHDHITVTTAGTPVQGPNVPIPDGFAVSLIYHPNNTGNIGIGKSSPAALLNKAISGEVIGSGDGSTTSFSGTLVHPPVVAGSITIHYTISSTAYTATDDGAGNISGTDCSGTINYSTGAWSLTFTTAPDSGTNITADYTVDAPGAVILTATGQSFAERVTNLNLLWFDVSVSGEKIIYAVEQ